VDEEAARPSGDRRRDPAVLEVELAVLDGRLVALRRGAKRLFVRAGLVELFLRDVLLLDQVLVPL